MSRRNEPQIDFKSQEGDSGLQESDWAPGWDGGAYDILLKRHSAFWNPAAWKMKATLLR
jgi:hypothetical protein